MWSCRQSKRLICYYGRLSRQLPQKAGRKYKSNTTGFSASGRERLKNGPSLEHFIANANPSSAKPPPEIQLPSVTYLNFEIDASKSKKVYFETYGCQMNVNDTEIAMAILENHGYTKTDDMMQSDAVLIMTCSIREGAEQKIWRHLEGLKNLQKHIRRQYRHRQPFKIGILGCMAENLKKKILERDQAVDIICGPDAYRDLPHLLAATTDTNQAAVNVQLSLEETYADVMPVRVNPQARTAFVSIMRGCDNMCSYCIVPFTRGRERSRPIDSILEEIRHLSDQGVKEVTLLGQNVNSYRDLSESVHYPTADCESTETTTETHRKPTTLADGFKTVYKPKVGGRRFSELLDQVSRVDSEMRIRFTSPHPKDFPDEVLELIHDRPNICNQLHMPAQSGSNAVLQAMRRGYTREAYLTLIDRVRRFIPDVSLSSDFIAGFCGETEKDHHQTLSLMEQVRYNYAYCFPYSMRGKTHAFHKLNDNVPEDVKGQRHLELFAMYQKQALLLKQAEIGTTQLVLVEGDSKRSDEEFASRNEGNLKVNFPKAHLPTLGSDSAPQLPQVGDYVAVKITGCTSQSFRGDGIYLTGLGQFHTQQNSSQRAIV